ncbi:hypothetical protein QP860_02325 [Aerococcus sp. UMB1112A]|uniref:hypothetical protein n=1 Tax=Aerococcus sp. UMB1112A TaxID=3050609 RepID=UPI00254A3747|nr:hypothetical protein [Aerococcus sp. UMB1112A]MDK8501883.1 hypothetical protein [Aerococcus sp. UMB1112A]
MGDILVLLILIPIIFYAGRTVYQEFHGQGPCAACAFKREGCAGSCKPIKKAKTSGQTSYYCKLK